MPGRWQLRLTITMVTPSVLCSLALRDMAVLGHLLRRKGEEDERLACLLDGTGRGQRTNFHWIHRG